MKQNKQGQTLIINFIFVVMGLIALYFAYQILSPVITQSLAGLDTSIQVLIMLIIPAMIFFFLIYMFKMFKRGESA